MSQVKRSRNCPPASSPKCGTSEHYRLLRLPSELRSLIYAFVFEDERPLRMASNIRRPDDTGYAYERAIRKVPCLLLVSKQISAEALALRQQVTTVLIEPGYASPHQVYLRPPSRRTRDDAPLSRLLRNIQVTGMSKSLFLSTACQTRGT